MSMSKLKLVHAMCCRLWLQILLFLFCESLAQFETSTQKCTFIRQTSFEQCGNRDAELKRYSDRDINRVYQPTVNEDNERCNGTNICSRLLKTGRISKLSFGSKISVQLSEALRHCCGNCTKYYPILLSSPLSKVSKSIIGDLDVIYPVYSQRNSVKLHGMNFIPVLNIPQAYYFTRKVKDSHAADAFVEALSKSWPLLIICLGTCLITGFFVWIVETWGNEKEFPRSFICGLKEGF